MNRVVMNVLAMMKMQNVKTARIRTVSATAVVIVVAERAAIALQVELEESALAVLQAVATVEVLVEEVSDPVSDPALSRH